MIHEYCLAKAATAGDRFPELDLVCYLRNLHEQIQCMDHPETKMAMADLLRSETRRLLGEYEPPDKSGSSCSSAVSSLRPNSWLTWAKQLFKSPATKPTWFFLADRLGIKPPNFIDFEFKSREKAIEFANRFPLPPQRNAEHLHWLVGETGRIREASIV